MSEPTPLNKYSRDKVVEKNKGTRYNRNHLTYSSRKWTFAENVIISNMARHTSNTRVEIVYDYVDGDLNQNKIYAFRRKLIG